MSAENGRSLNVPTSMIFSEKLRIFESQLRNKNAPVLNHFLKGLEREEITREFRKLKLSPPEMLIDLYCWKNGVRWIEVPTGQLDFGVSGIFMSLQDAIEAYQISTGIIGGNFFPIFFEEFFLINLDTQSDKYGWVYIYSPSLIINAPKACFESLDVMISMFTECFKDGVFLYDENGLFDSHLEKEREIARRYNPYADYWQDR